MYSGIHQNLMWEIEDGELRIASRNPRVGVIATSVVTNRFNNAEQATWFAQARIDTQLESLQALDSEG